MPDNTVKAGFLPLYLALYEDISPGYYKRFAPFIGELTALIEGAGVSVVPSETAFTASHIGKARELFEEEDVSFIILVHLCYSPSLLIADFLEEMKLPLLMVDSTAAPSFDNMDSEYLMQNHGIHGVMDLTSVLKSRGTDYFVVSGHRSDPAFKNRLERQIKAMKGAALYKNQVIGLTGAPFEGMGDFSVDFDALKNDFGITVRNISPELLAETSEGISEKDIDSIVAEDAAVWDISGISTGAHREAARSFIALNNILDGNNCSGYTMNFQHITEGMATPFYACSRVMSEGLGYGGEGDVITASLGYPINQIASAAKFDEFFCADWENDTILMSHMGESDSRFVKKNSNPSLTVRDGFVNPRDSVIYRFQAEPGEVTFVNLCPAEGGYRMVSGLLDIVDAPILDEITSPHYQVHTRMRVNRFLERYAAAGGGHHLYIAYGNILDEMEIFSRILGFDFTVINEE